MGWTNSMAVFGRCAMDSKFILGRDAVIRGFASLTPLFGSSDLVSSSVLVRQKQIKSIRPFASGNEVSITQRMLDWRLEMMQKELLSETNFLSLEA